MKGPDKTKLWASISKYILYHKFWTFKELLIVSLKTLNPQLVTTYFRKIASKNVPILAHKYLLLTEDKIYIITQLGINFNSDTS